MSRPGIGSDGYYTPVNGTSWSFWKHRPVPPWWKRIFGYA